MRYPDLLVLLFLVVGAAASVHWKKLTPAAALTGGILGWAIYAGGSFMGLTLLALFFILGTAATSWQKRKKAAIRGSAAHQRTRKAGQVIANAGVAALMGALAVIFPAWKPLFQLMLAASLASATADTLSSELGMVYGRRNFNILTWKRDERGLDGVVSIEGLLIGTLGAALMTAVYLAMTPIGYEQAAWTHPAPAPLSRAWIIIAAGTFGNLADSLLGATLERRGLLSNDAVNFLNTLLAAILAGALIIG